MKEVKSYNDYNYVNVSAGDLKLGDTILSGEHSGQVATLSQKGIWITVTLIGHPYDTEVHHINGDDTVHLVVENQAEWDDRLRNQYSAYESLNS
jgi:hypothetical protein